MTRSNKVVLAGVASFAVAIAGASISAEARNCNADCQKTKESAVKTVKDGFQGGGTHQGGGTNSPGGNPAGHGQTNSP